jgi:hypothetical protein
MLLCYSPTFLKPLNVFDRDLFTTQKNFRLLPFSLPLLSDYGTILGCLDALVIQTPFGELLLVLIFTESRSDESSWHGVLHCACSNTS